MMKKTVLAGMLFATCALVGSEMTFADEVNLKEKDSTANVEITKGKDPITPTEPEPQPGTGPYVPVIDLGITSATDLYFDAIPLSTSTTVRQALYIDRTTKQPVSNTIDKETGSMPEIINANVYTPGYSVTDLRGTGAGWTLTVSLGKFMQTDAADGAAVHELRGAILSFPEVTPITVATAAPTADEIPKTFKQDVSAGAQTIKIMNADDEKGAGKGLWEARYNSRALDYGNGTKATVAPIELSVPGDNYVGKYQATLTWNLTDSPQP